MNISEKTRKLVILSFLSALIILLTFTPLGYLKFGGISITLLCIPVIVGTIMEGLVPGLILALLFGITSFVQAFLGDILGQTLFNISPARYTMLVFLPRLCIPLVVHFSKMLTDKIFKYNLKKLGIIIVAGIGSLTNTVLFLTALYQFFMPEIGDIAAMLGTVPEKVKAALAAIAMGNGIPEAIAAMIIVPLIIIPLEMIYKKEPKEAKDDSNI